MARFFWWGRKQHFYFGKLILIAAFNDNPTIINNVIYIDKKHNKL